MVVKSEDDTDAEYDVARKAALCCSAQAVRVVERSRARRLDRAIDRASTRASDRPFERPSDHSGDQASNRASIRPTESLRHHGRVRHHATLSIHYKLLQGIVNGFPERSSHCPKRFGDCSVRWCSAHGTLEYRCATCKSGLKSIGFHLMNFPYLDQYTGQAFFDVTAVHDCASSLFFAEHFPCPLT